MVQMYPMNSICDIYRPSGNIDSSGRPDGQFVTVLVNMPASIRALNGRELEYARKLEETASYQVQFYWDHDLQPLPDARWRVFDKAHGKTLELVEPPRSDNEDQFFFTALAGELRT